MRQTYNPGANHIRIIDYSLPIADAEIHYQDLSKYQQNKQPAQHRLLPCSPSDSLRGCFATHSVGHMERFMQQKSSPPESQ
jgi:hypothetical protein